jgi:predicted hydrolase (HD superfamily)
MDRQEAYELAKSKFSNKNLFKHVLAMEAVMRGLAEHFSEDQEKWGLVGLLHDLDYEQTMNDPDRHTLKKDLRLVRIGSRLRPAKILIFH